MITATKVSLTKFDRCCASASGACAATTLVQLHEGSEPLLFCSHHFDVHREALLALHPFLIQGETDE